MPVWWLRNSIFKYLVASLKRLKIFLEESCLKITRVELIRFHEEHILFFERFLLDLRLKNYVQGTLKLINCVKKCKRFVLRIVVNFNEVWENL